MVVRLFVVEISVEEVSKTITGIAHLQVYEITREFDGILVENRCVVRVPLVYYGIHCSNLLYPFEESALLNALDFALLGVINFGCNLYTGFVGMQTLGNVVV
jgi:hypothetical protein